jgi:hypothetical protein
MIASVQNAINILNQFKDSCAGLGNAKRLQMNPVIPLQRMPIEPMPT